MSTKTSAKAKLRSEIRQALGILPVGKIATDSRELRNQLRFPKGSKVALFAGTATEPSLLDLIDEDQSIKWFLPKVITPSKMEFLQVTSGFSLEKGSFNILEPREGPKAGELDYIVCPGLAFTMEGKRLGQGGGFYDRTLLKYPGARVLGVAFDLQIVKDLPSEDHDREMDLVLTPETEVPDGIPEC